MIMRNNLKVVEDKDSYTNAYGIAVEDVRCKCGRKLCEVEERLGSVVRIKCKRCGKIVRVKI